MKIIYITRAAFGLLGGADSYLIPTYANKKCDVTVLSNFIPHSKEKVVFSCPDLEIHDVYSRNTTERVLKVLNHIYKIKPDIIHIFHGPDCLRYPYLLRGLTPNVKWVLDFRSPPVTKNRTELNKVLWRYFLCQFYYDQILTHSKLTIKDNLPFRFKRFIELPLGVELAKIPFANIGKLKPVKFVYIGSVTKSRQLFLLVESFAKFAANTEARVTLDIIGDGNAVGPINELISSKKINNHVQLKGFLPQHEIYKIMQNYDVGIAYVPYDKFTRAPSLKSLEYAAAGLPVLASDTKGHKDFVNRFGFKFDLFKNSSNGIIDAFECFLKDGVSHTKINNNLKVVKTFDWENLIENILIPTYTKLLKTHHNLTKK